MESIGKFLQDKRKEQGLSLEDIMIKTRLQVNLLKKIESNNFSELGGEGYTRILLLTYGKALGLNDQELESSLGLKGRKDVYVKRSCDEPLYPVKFLFHKNMFLGIILLALTILLAVLVVRMYKDGRIGFPFKTGQIQQIQDKSSPTIDNPVEQIEEENDAHIDAATNQSQSSESLPIESFAGSDVDEIQIKGSDESIAFADNHSDKSNSFLDDRSDYLATILDIKTEKYILATDKCLVTRYLITD